MAKTLIGMVSSNKPDKTIVVTVQTTKTHPLYSKKYFVSKKFMAHDEHNEAQEGDKVAIVETRPLSAVSEAAKTLNPAPKDQPDRVTLDPLSTPARVSAPLRISP